jgi:tetratricopeptide (TPR) repeat protein
MRQRPLPRALGSLALVLLGCRSTEQRAEEKVAWNVQHGRYAEAVAEAQRLVRESPGDVHLQRLLRDAQVAYILDRGRQAVFLEDLDVGLQLFEQARELDPENPSVARWIEKTRAQLARHWLDRAVELTGPDQLEEAEEAYENVLLYDPENTEAQRGLAHVLLLQNYRSGQSKSYFDEGLGSFRMLLLEQARRSFLVSRRYRESKPAAARSEQVALMLAQERLAQARSFEAGGLYSAARNEYRLVLLIEPGSVDAKAGLDRMDREVRALHTLSEADMEIRRGELEKASQSLEEAAVLTEAQRDDLSVLRGSIEERSLQKIYDEARNLETDYRYPEAVAAYDELLAQAPDFADAARRRATLDEFIRLAEELYAQVLETQSDEEAEKILRAILVVNPEYKDVLERLQAIERRRAQSGGDGPDGEAAPAEPKKD